LNLEGFVINSD